MIKFGWSQADCYNRVWLYILLAQNWVNWVLDREFIVMKYSDNFLFKKNFVIQKIKDNVRTWI